jgi:hypothetical protein
MKIVYASSVRTYECRTGMATMCVKRGEKHELQYTRGCVVLGATHQQHFRVVYCKINTHFLRISQSGHELHIGEHFLDVRETVIQCTVSQPVCSSHFEFRCVSASESPVLPFSE